MMNRERTNEQMFEEVCHMDLPNILDNDTVCSLFFPIFVMSSLDRKSVV